MKVGNKMSYTYEITDAGKALIAKAQTGTNIDITRAEIGKGDLDISDTPADFTGLIETVSINVELQFKEYIEGSDQAKITLTYNNEGLSEGFSVKEIGLFANDPDVGEILFLYCYSSDADFLPSGLNTKVEQVVNLIIKVDNAENVIAQIAPEAPVIRNNFSANSILKADIDNEPEVLIVSEDRIIGRKTGGEIDDLIPDEVREIQNLATNDALFKKNITVDGDVQFKKYNAGLLTSDESGNIASCGMAENTIAGRTNGDINDLSPNDVRSILNLATNNAVLNGDVQLKKYGTGFMVSDDSGNLNSLSLTGFVTPWPTSNVPAGFLSCNGASVSRTTYEKLFSVIGTGYGSVDSTHFNLPDYRGEFLRGWDNGAGNDPDRLSRTNRGDGTTKDNVGTKQSHQYETHTHPNVVRTPGNITFVDANGSHTTANTQGQVTGPSGGNETRPRNVSVQYIIKT
ncbi:MAG: tail fiber protein [Desulfobacterales bacterium]|nr:tail fiber protein [Desulfobacterales bacterium]